MPLNNQERELFEQLITASQTLITVCKNAATVLSEEFEDMITGPAGVVEDILNKCPDPTVTWDGSFNIADCDEELFTPDLHEELASVRKDTGVRLTHRLSGMSVEVYSSRDVAENRARAHRALQQRVSMRYGGKRKDPLG